LKSYLALQTLQLGGGTHVVVGITWGARSVVTVKHRFSESADRNEVEGQFQVEFSKFKSIMEIAGKASLQMETGQADRQMSFEVSVHGDVLANDGLLPTDFPKACTFISNIPKYIQSANGGKGKPLTYMLFPIDILAMLFQVGIGADVAVRQLNVQCLHGFVQLFDKMREAQQKLNDYESDVKNHKFCVPEDHIKLVAEQVNTAKVAELTLKSEYARMLKDVRSGKADAEQLSNLLKESHACETLPHKLVAVTNGYRSTVKFADALLSKGATYLGYDAKSLTSELSKNGEDDAYVFRFDKKSMLDRASWEGNFKLLMELLSDTKIRSPVILVDYDA
jgi:hypothetical protein